MKEREGEREREREEKRERREEREKEKRREEKRRQENLEVSLRYVLKHSTRRGSNIFQLSIHQRSRTTLWQAEDDGRRVMGETVHGKTALKNGNSGKKKMKASEWGFDRIKEAFEKVAQDQAEKVSIVQEIMLRSTD